MGVGGRRGRLGRGETSQAREDEDEAGKLNLLGRVLGGSELRAWVLMLTKLGPPPLPGPPLFSDASQQVGCVCVCGP